jgi:3-phenylpropionate/trans-cinnamate dioxygenase ferredoxin subunit
MTGQFVNVGSLLEFEEGRLRRFIIDGRDIILVKHNGQIFALDDLCTHDGGNLSDGSIKDSDLVCPRHGARFDIKTGAPTGMPAVAGISTYEIKIENDQIYLGLPE